MSVRRKIPSGLQVRAAVEPSTFDADRGTVEVVFSTGARVRRQDWEGTYLEELEVSERAMDLSRLNNGAPYLDSHQAYGGIRAVLGVVERAWVAGAQARALVRFSEREDVRPIREDVRAGILRHVSVGYSVQKYEQVEKVDEVPVYRATKWTPYEISQVPMGADDAAVVRGRDEPEFYEVEVHLREKTMENENEPHTPTTPQPQPEVLAERQRVATITDLVSRSHLEPAFARRLVDNGVTLDLARTAIINELARRSDAIHTAGHLPSLDQERRPVVPGQDFADDFHRAAVDSMLLRAGIPVAKPHAAARDVSGSSLDLAELCLSRAGRPGGLRSKFSRSELIKRAMTTSDFPLVLTNGLHAAIRHGYETEPASHRAWVRAVPVPDFRVQERPILGSAPALAQVLEAGEYTNGAMDEDSTSYQVAKYGRIVSLTWEVLTNDQLGAFLRVQPALGQAARRLEADTVYALFALNTGAGPVMQDTVNLFHTTHANLVTGAAFDAALLGAARTLLRKQTALGGGYMALAPRYWIVPAERETAAEVILSNATRRATTEKTTPEWIANLELVVEPRLASTACFLAADPAQIDTVEMGLLEENINGPVLDEEEEFRRDVKSWKVRHVLGAKALDWRGLVRMPITG